MPFPKLKAHPSFAQTPSHQNRSEKDQSKCSVALSPVCDKLYKVSFVFPIYFSFPKQGKSCPKRTRKTLPQILTLHLQSTPIIQGGRNESKVKEHPPFQIPKA